MNYKYSFKNDFILRIKENPNEIKFISDFTKINSYKAYSYYYDQIENKLKPTKKVAFICDSSLDSHILSFFLIFSHYEILFLSADQTQSEIENALKTNSISIIVGFDQAIHNNKNLNFIQVIRLKDFNITDEISREIFNNIIFYENQKIKNSIFMSSGSTAKPKFIPLENRQLNCSYNSIKIGFLNDLEYTRIISIHDTSFVILLNFLQAFCAKRGSILFANDFRSKDLSLIILAKFLNDDSEDLIISVPSVYSAILKLLKNKVKTLKNKSLISCGEPLGSKLAQDTNNLNPKSFLNLYGSTELASWILWLDVPLYLNRTKFITPILPTGNPLPFVKLELSKDNELLVNSECIFKGYINKTNKETFVKKNSTLFFKTGDKFLIEKNLYICEGRINNAIKIAGRFINPMLIEADLKLNFDIADIVVVPYSSSIAIEILLFIDSKDKDKFDLKDIKLILHKHISKKTLTRIKFVTDEPNYLRSGKINRKFYSRAAENII